jgi:hypothetical protein
LSFALQSNRKGDACQWPRFYGRVADSLRESTQDYDIVFADTVEKLSGFRARSKPWAGAEQSHTQAIEAYDRTMQHFARIYDCGYSQRHEGLHVNLLPPLSPLLASDFVFAIAGRDRNQRLAAGPEAAKPSKM